MKRLSLLSGGEKSLTALAFLFAVFLARPCPFYILDEVEAALDDLNIDRFLTLLRRFSDRAQFIVVTHQKRTMEAADTLYGVSMGGDGVSKVVSRRLPPRRRRRCRGLDRGPRGAADAAAILRAADGPRLDRAVRQPTARVPGAASRGAREAGAAASSAACARTCARRARRSPPRSRPRCSSDLDEETWERLEEALIYADVGARTTAEVVERLEQRGEAGDVTGGEALTARLAELLAELAPHRRRRRSTCARDPTVILVVGVNGTGKTTTIGKLAWHLRHELGRSVVIGAARHVPRRGGRAARALGASAPAATSSRAPRARTPARSPSTRSPAAASAAPTWSSSTPPGACTPRTT